MREEMVLSFILLVPISFPPKTIAINWWFHNRNLLFLVLQASSQKSVSLTKSRCHQGFHPSEAQGDNPPFPFPAFGDCRHSLACSCITVILHKTSIFKSLFLHPLPTFPVHDLSLFPSALHVIAFRAHPDILEGYSHL